MDTSDGRSLLGGRRTRNRPCPRVLLARSEGAARDELAGPLTESGFEVETVGSGRALEHRLARVRQFDAVVVGLSEHDQTAVDLTERVRQADDEVAVIAMVDSPDDALLAAVLEAGADDVIDMPSTALELTSRLHAVLRRTPERQHMTLVYGDLELDLVSRRARRGAREFELTPIEFNLIELFLRNPEEVLSREMIFEEVWGYAIEFSSNSLDVYIGSLRRKTEADRDPRLIHTVRSVGYVLRGH
jgi:two-component system response regulator MprA